ncbi:MAG: ATP-dependent DNA helicase RecG [Myxococcota bacterium]
MAVPPPEPKPAPISAAARKAWAVLRDRLSEAAAEGFARIEAPGVADGLRQAWRAFAEAGGQLGSRPGEQDAFAEGLERLDMLGRQDRSVVVAHGMRLCMTWEGRAPAAPARPNKRVPRHRAASAAAAPRRTTRGEPRPKAAVDDGEETEAPAPQGAAKKSSARKGAKKGTAKKSSANEGAAKKTSTNKGAAKKATAAKKTSAKKGSSKKRASKKTASQRSGDSKPSTAAAVDFEAPLDELPPLAHAPVTVLPRVGPSTASKLETRGLATLEDLVFFLPAGYRDHRERKPPGEAADGEVISVEVMVERFRQGFIRGGRFLATAEVVDDDGTPLTLRWFHRVGGLAQRVELGARLLVVGAVREHAGRLGIVHPEVYPSHDPPPPIGVRYPVVEGIGARTISNVVRKALDRLLDTEAIEDLLPEKLAKAHALPTLAEALRWLHDPAPDLPPPDVQLLRQGRSPAHRRLAFGELFLLQLLLLRRRRHWCVDQAAFVTPEAGFDREGLRACLPFEPTGAQWRVIDEIETDMASGHPMLRLLQGDVGSGKTAVAFAAIRAAVAAGAQAALMAPTEILAEQHLRTLEPWCKTAGLKVALLTGAMPRAQRNSLLALLAAGKIDVLVGTHALLVADVSFAALGLVVVDEQHRFGVEQRALLRDKGERPHLLVMTATPIPRTLALTAYGELEVSLIDELPPGREPPVTRLLAGKPALMRARKTIARAVRKDAQAFVVCPLVEASEAIDASHVEASAAALRELMPDVEIGIVHGRMSSEDKDAVMNAFREGRYRVLVATTVIEVGVDVPAARAILVEHAERFGLAQLHQLRGRIGRGGGASLCLIHTALGPKSESAQRLAVMTETSDGFAVAEHDLAMRGPGEIFGTRQAGVPRLRFMGFAGEGTRMLLDAREAAATLLEEDPDLAEHPLLRTAIEQREHDAPVYSAESG